MNQESCAINIIYSCLRLLTVARAQNDVYVPYYRHGIGEAKSAAGKIETDYYFKGKKVSKEEYETKIKEDSLKK